VTHAQPLFSVRLVAGWLAAAALTSIVSLALIVRDSGSVPHPDEAGPTIYSRSALGYAALYRTLSDLGIPVGDNTAESLRTAGTGAVVVAEPKRDKDALAHVRSVLQRAPAVLLVLPKRRGTPDPDRPGMLRRDTLVPLEDAQTVMALVDAGATVERAVAAEPWSVRAPLAGAPSVRAPQLVRSGVLQPLLRSPAGMLIGETELFGRRVVVVSDPDILENHGLARGDNALLAVALVRSLRGAGGRVVFDEVPHGFVSRPFGIVRLLLSFPFVLVTAQIALACGLLLWSAAGRFGAPVPREASLPLGKRSLIEGGSRLLAYAGRLAFVLDRYAEAMVRETAARLHAPRGLGYAELVAWLDRTGRTVPQTAAAPAAAPDELSAVAAAHTIHCWRNEVLDEPG
jgi:hypothetical protein